MSRDISVCQWMWDSNWSLDLGRRKIFSFSSPLIRTFSVSCLASIIGRESGCSPLYCLEIKKMVGVLIFRTMTMVRQHRHRFIPLPTVIILSLRWSYQFYASVVNRPKKLYANDLTPSYTSCVTVCI